mgnify:FL=1
MHQLQSELDEARKEREHALERFVAEQEKAFEEKEREGLDKLQERKRELESNVEMHEKRCDVYCVYL